MTRHFSAFFKLARVGLHLIHGLWVVNRHFPRWQDHQKAKRIQAWARSSLALLGIDLKVNGNPPGNGPLLLVANHVSWLDIVVLLASCPCRFVSKSEIGQWPVVGTLTRAAGTLFITRSSRRDALRVVHQMAEKLHADSGMVLAIFPEGTTSNGLQVLPFHANLFQAAISANAPVQTVAVRFEETASGRHSQAACYIDDDTFLGSLWRTLTAPQQRVVLSFGSAQHAGGRNRQDWAADAHAEVAGMLKA
ncbi:lysophospholipid acyltransferase family protein [Rhodoferax sp.]|uniref:lysophospholipid acyltransferase family protein n=1 Tax=Rhodoferax sp. TaxID=50421 RepID=UPI0025DE595A|nr:lysophospholipid acyltransferase family protein [Rhodoferax sp.]MCM2296869.1 1-acyl-sn-glycerol-3-phosphate acyltransferase [Rhodoferax sp.]